MIDEGKLILRAFFARSPDGSTVLFRYYFARATLRRRAGHTLGFATHFYFVSIPHSGKTEVRHGIFGEKVIMN